MNIRFELVISRMFSSNFGMDTDGRLGKSAVSPNNYCEFAFVAMKLVLLAMKTKSNVNGSGCVCERPIRHR